MANPEHVAVVRKGPEAILEWRVTHPDQGLDLREAIFRDADLRTVDLSKADLGGAEFLGANLSWVDFSGADLSEARLVLANMRGATLSGVNLSGATFGLTSFTAVDLSGAKGLKEAKHEWPSSIGVDTLMRSLLGAGNVPRADLRTFFRGAGVPQELLDALPGIASEIEYYSCFISYREPDLKFAEKLCEDLTVAGAACWFYPRDSTVGRDTQREIAAARRRMDKMIVICSVAGLTQDGLLKEIEDQAEEDAGKLMPVSLDLVWRKRNFQVVRGAQDLKPFLFPKNYGCFESWDSEAELYQKGLGRLLKGLKRPPVQPEGTSN